MQRVKPSVSTWSFGLKSHSARASLTLLCRDGCFLQSRCGGHTANLKVCNTIYFFRDLALTMAHVCPPCSPPRIGWGANSVGSNALPSRRNVRYSDSRGIFCPTLTSLLSHLFTLKWYRNPLGRWAGSFAE